MLFTKQVFVFSSLLLGVSVSAVPVALPMPVANAVSQMQSRDVKLIQAYQKRQDIVTIGDSDPVTAPDGIVRPYGTGLTKRQDIVTIGDSEPVTAPDDIVTIGDSEPVTAPDGIVRPYGTGLTKRQEIVTIGDSEPVTAPDGIVRPYGTGITKRQDPNIVTISDSEPVTAPDGVVKSYPQPAARSVSLRMRRTRSTRSHA
ncbi:hypothetical protein FS749_013500 [Ceratobasidium sp. UAMH 11750]|nr:hypothetical protein FS749_013500 [Ceratobasidium sp. UAMH 11750]